LLCLTEARPLVKARHTLDGWRGTITFLAKGRSVFHKPMQNSRLYIALARPDRLIEALALVLQARDEFAACHLIYEDSGWWTRNSLEKFRPFFARIDAVPKVWANRGLSDLPRHWRALGDRQRQLASLRIQPGDVIVCLAAITGLANALASAYPAVPKILCVALKKYLDASREPDFRQYRHTTSSWWQNHVLEPGNGVGRTLHLKPWRSGGGDGIRLERLERPLLEVFQGIVVLSNEGTDLPAGYPKHVLASRFPDLTEIGQLLPKLQALPADRPEVVFFGTPFLLVRNLPPAEYAEILNRGLDYLRRHYGRQCRLCYRPHPAEKEESQWLRLAGFDLAADGEVAELYLLRQAPSIAAVYSVSSTVSRVAANFGLNAYCLWRCFPFGPAASAYFESMMGRVPPEFEIRTLDEAPIAYAHGMPLPAASALPREGFGLTVLRAVRAAQAGAATQNPFADTRSSPV
jgi:hypothetical protein